jgi:hypothetical protein
MSVAETEPTVFRWHAPEHLPCGGCFRRLSLMMPSLTGDGDVVFSYYLAGCACGLHVIETVATSADEAIAYLRDAGWLIEDSRVVCRGCRCGRAAGRESVARCQ